MSDKSKVEATAEAIVSEDTPHNKSVETSTAIERTAISGEQFAAEKSDSSLSEHSMSTVEATKNDKEIGGRDGPDPTRYGDWEMNGRCIDF